ncbi:hypothetical protein [Tomitella gaofuii]|uniref:hypothetical protein n=1 Tax=Tomitella gaofuii TaxID=2760083 RepID=UPI001F404BD8|nr:hypothetical protein [Tomitella gaofuii]
MALPLFLLAHLWDRFDLGNRRALQGRGISIGPLRTHTTALVSGLLFIGIGVLFLLTDGTANLGGIIGIDADQRIQTIVGDVAASVSNTAVVFVLLVSAALVLGFRLLPRRHTRQTTGEREHEHNHG